MRTSRGRIMWWRHVILAALVTTLMPGTAFAAVRPAGLISVPATRPVPVHVVPSHKVKAPVMPAWHRPAVTWPAGTGAATTAPSGPSRAGTLPVWVGSARNAHVQVVMASRQATTAAGISGVIFSVAQTTQAQSPLATRLSLNYSSFAFADGGDYGARLHLVELPACALTTPQVPACRRQTPLDSSNDVRRFMLTANVTLPADPSAGYSPAIFRQAPAAVVLAATTSTSGSAGSYTATPLSEAGTWSAGSSSGAFTYSYPIDVPPVPGGLAPKVSLDYNSQAVDGLTSSTNNQASWIGDGWDYQPGFIERDYQSCEQNPAGSTKTGDLCWSSNDVTTLSLGGVTTTLADDPATGWHAEADNGYKISYLTGSGSNGTHDDDYWVVTDPDGTSYYFGLNELLGYTSSDTTTNSAWTVPVYATASGQPCYNATFSSSHCLQAWRWNLDYVTDSQGNASAYYYNTETNHYAADNGTTATASYTQGGALSKIEYGLRTSAPYGTPAAEVTFTAPETRTDIPTGSSADLACSSGASCLVISPTFWIKYHLTTITTYSLESGTLTAVDSWALTQDYPATGDGSATPPLWLESIARTGEDGSTHITLPAVSFSGGTAGMANRVETATDLNDGYSIIDRFRILTVTNETGGVTSVTYDTPPSSCTSGNFPSETSNTTLCYPDYWTPPGASSPIEDWFNKYVVAAITQSNTVGGTTPVTTKYSYSGAAWHYNDSTLTRSDQRTWDQWRGFRKVTTETGASPDPVTETTSTYFQGMDGDYQGSGNAATSASLTSSLGSVTVTDSPQFAGVEFEKTAYNGAGGAVVTDTVTTPWSSAATATQSQPSPLPALTAYMTGVAETRTYTALASGGYREADDTFTHDSYGRVTVESKVPDASDNGNGGDPGEDTCTQTTYAANTTSWLLDLPAEVIVTSVPPASCPVSGTPAEAELVSDTRTYYDSSTTLGAAPSAGNVTMTTKTTSYSSGAEVPTTESKSTYDEYGRVLTATDADNNTTTTTYTPPTGAEPTSETVTDPMGLLTTTTYDPARDLPLTVTSPANWVTTETYDALGRLTAVWTQGHATSGPADKTFSYTMGSATAPSAVVTNTINASGTYLPSETLYDSLGRQIETQTETPAGGRDITDTYYNSDGWTLKTSSAYYTTGAPSGTLVAANDDQVPSQTGYFYDGDGRVLRKVLYSYATEKWETDTSYGGDYTTVTPPSGGTTQTTYTNGDGLTSYIYQYHSATPPASPPAPGAGSVAGSSGWDQTAYTYTPDGKTATITDTAGNVWSYIYNLDGDQVTATDPDSGTTNSTYDADGNLLSTTDARAKTISYTYDKDNRKTAKYDTTNNAAESGSDELASWTYDTLAKGQLSSSASYVGGTSGTTYTEAVSGYDTYGLPSGQTVTISGGTLAGTYRELSYYSTYGDLPTETYYYAAGGLPAEAVQTGYNTADEPVSVGSSLWTYVSALSYTNLGQPQEYAFGTTTEPAWLIDSYDAATGQLATSGVQVGSSPVTIDATTYSYNAAGLITAEADTPANGPSQVQCFNYDYLGRLTQAWSEGTSACASGPSQSAETGAAAGYWEQYAYNTVNDLTGETSTPASGSATTTTFSYPAAGAARPHAVTSSSAVTGSSTTATSYTYDGSGDTATISSPSDTQTLSWDPAGKLASVTSTGGTNPGSTSYVYSADGNLLLQTDPGAATLYLPGEQITENTTTGAFSSTRYYTLGGTTAAARTSTGNVYYLVGDQQGTDTIAIENSALAVSYRYYDPYGNPVGTPPSVWPGNEGFTGGTTDASTGLVNLGAREYSPATGSFVSPDPLLDPGNPQDLNAYAYAGDDPATNSDPSGAMFGGAPSPCGVDQANCGPGAGQHVTGTTPQCGVTYQCYTQAPTVPACPVVLVQGCGGRPIYQAPPVIHVITRSPRAVTPRQTSIGLADASGCSGRLLMLGACRSEAGAAGTTPAEVRQSLIGAASIIGGAIAGPALGLLGDLLGSGTEGVAAADAVGDTGGAATRVFWSGGDVAKEPATEWATANGGETIGMTAEGSFLEATTQDMPWSEARPLWNAASQRFAEGAVGEVHVFQNAAGVGVKSIWAETEYPTLLGNQDVTDIIYHVVGG